MGASNLLIVVAALTALMGVRGAEYELNIAVLNQLPLSVAPLGLMSNYTPSLKPYSVGAERAQFLGAQLWEQRVNALSGIPIRNDRLRPRLHYFNAGPTTPAANATRNLNAVMANITSGAYGVYFPAVISLPGPNSPAMAAAAIAPCEELAGTPRSCVVVHPVNPQPSVFRCVNPLPIECVRKNRRAGLRRFDYGFSAQRRSESVGTTFINFIATYARTMAILVPPGGDKTALVAAAQAVRIDARLHVYTPLLTTEDGVALLYNVTNQLTSKPDVIMFILATGPPDTLSCRNILKAQAAIDWMPAAFYLPQECVTATYRDDAEIAAGNLNQYVFYEAAWVPTATGSDFRAVSQPGATLEPWAATDTLDSPQVFAADMLTTLGSNVGGLAPSLGAFSAIVIHKAVEVMGSVNVTGDSLKTGIEFLNVPSHHGLIQFDSLHFFSSPTLILQLGLGNVATALTPITQKVSEAVYPTPLFSERVYTPSYISVASIADGSAHDRDVAILILTTICLAYACGLLVTMIVHRKHNVIVAATPLFCYFTILGSIVLMASVYVWMPFETSVTCSSKIWFLQFGWTLMFGSLLIKSVRVWLIVDHRRTLEAPRIRLEHLVIALGVLLGAELIYTAIWQLVAPFSVQTMVVDPVRPALNYEQCVVSSDSVGGESAQSVFITISLCLKFVMVATSTVAAFRTRAVRSEFNESFHIGAGVWAMLCIMVVVVPVVYTSSDRLFSFVVRSAGILVLGVTTITCVFVPKLIAIRNYPKNVPIAATQQSIVSIPMPKADMVKPMRPAINNLNGAGAVGQPSTVDAHATHTLTAIQPSELGGPAHAVPVDKAPVYAAAGATSNNAGGGGGGGGASAIMPSLLGASALAGGGGGGGGGGSELPASGIDLDLRERIGLLERLLDEAFVRCPHELSDLSTLRKRMPRSRDTALPLPPASNLVVNGSAARASTTNKPAAWSGNTNNNTNTGAVDSGLPPVDPNASSIQLSDVSRTGGGGGGQRSQLSTIQSASGNSTGSGNTHNNNNTNNSTASPQMSPLPISIGSTGSTGGGGDGGGGRSGAANSTDRDDSAVPILVPISGGSSSSSSTAYPKTKSPTAAAASSAAGSVVIPILQPPASMGLPGQAPTSGLGAGSDADGSLPNSTLSN